MRLIFFTGLMVLSLHLSAQRVMILEKLGRGHWYRYETGDDITFQRIHDDVRFTGTITSITDSTFILDMAIVVPITEVKYVWRKFPSRKKNGNLVMIAGGVLVGITAINNLAKGRTVIDPVYLAVGAGISVAGLLWRLSSQPRYTVGMKWKLKVLDKEFL